MPTLSRGLLLSGGIPAEASGHPRRPGSAPPKERNEIARKAVEAGWAEKKAEQKAQGHSGSASIPGLEANSPLKPEIEPATPPLPVAKYKGALNFGEIGGQEIPCYVLEGGRRVIGRTSFTEMLTGIEGGGDLEKYLGVRVDGHGTWPER